MSKKVENFIEDVKKELGDKLVGVVNQIELNGQVAFCTNEPDKGPNVPADHVDLFERIMLKHGIPAAMLPYPVNGRIAYVVAGLNRIK